MTTEQTLPITAMLKKDIENLIRQEILCMGEKEGDRYSQKRIHIQMLLPQVRTLEEAQQKKAKEEERERIVGILLKRGREQKELRCSTVSVEDYDDIIDELISLINF